MDDLVKSVRTSYSAVLRSRATEWPDEVFLETWDQVRWTYRDLDGISDAVAGWLVRNGCRPGDRIVCMAGNRAELVATMVGANRAGAVFVPLNPELVGSFLHHQITNAEPVAIFVEEALVPRLKEIDLPGTVHHVVVFDGASPGATPWDEVIDRGATAEPIAIEPDDVSTIMYTSGTTGPAKGVLMPHAHCVLFGAGIARHLQLTAADVSYVSLPLFHANGLFMQVGAALLAGARVHVARRFSASGWLDDMRRSGATVTHLLGVMGEFVLAQPASAADRDHRLRAVLDVPVSDERATAFRERFGVQVVHGFGMTECNMVTYSNPDEATPRSSGNVIDDAFEVAIAESGEILVRPRVPGAFMAGYFRMPERTVEAWQGLWFHTGDTGRLDDEGRLHFVDRIKDCIRRRGENISSYEIEQVVTSHPDVVESAAIGIHVPDAGGEDEILVCVVARDGAELSAADVVEFCRTRMPRHTVPRFVRFMEALPKTSTGKLQKADLRARFGTEPGSKNRK